jgi:hypothetical protein
MPTKKNPKTRKKTMPSLGGMALSHPERLTLAQIRELGGHEIAHQAAHKKTQRKKKRTVKRTVKRVSRR